MLSERTSPSPARPVKICLEVLRPESGSSACRAACLRRRAWRASPPGNRRARRRAAPLRRQPVRSYGPRSRSAPSGSASATTPSPRGRSAPRRSPPAGRARRPCRRPARSPEPGAAPARGLSLQGAGAGASWQAPARPFGSQPRVETRTMNARPLRSMDSSPCCGRYRPWPPTIPPSCAPGPRASRPCRSSRPASPSRCSRCPRAGSSRARRSRRACRLRSSRGRRRGPSVCAGNSVATRSASSGVMPPCTKAHISQCGPRPCIWPWPPRQTLPPASMIFLAAAATSTWCQSAGSVAMMPRIRPSVSTTPCGT